MAFLQSIRWFLSCISYFSIVLLLIVVVQLLDCYLEAYQHVFDRDEQRSLAQVITNIMHRRPRFDFNADYFVRCYQLECYCLRLQTELVKSILTAQVRNHSVSMNTWFLEISFYFLFMSANKYFSGDSKFCLLCFPCFIYFFYHICWNRNYQIGRTVSYGWLMVMYIFILKLMRVGL